MPHFTVDQVVATDHGTGTVLEVDATLANADEIMYRVDLVDEGAGWVRESELDRNKS